MNAELGRMEGWLLFDDGKIDVECSGIGMIYGVHNGHVEQIFEEVIKNIKDGDIEIDLSGMRCVNFEINNITYEEGQMTFPETGQWDFPPHWEFDFKILEIEQFTHDLGMSMDDCSDKFKKEIAGAHADINRKSSNFKYAE